MIRHRVYPEPDNRQTNPFSPHHQKRSPTKNTDFTDDDEGFEGSEGYMTDGTQSEHYQPQFDDTLNESPDNSPYNTDNDKAGNPTNSEISPAPSHLLDGNLASSTSSLLAPASSSSMSISSAPTITASSAYSSPPLAPPKAQNKSRTTPRSVSPNETQRPRKLSQSETVKKYVFFYNVKNFVCFYWARTYDCFRNFKNIPIPSGMYPIHKMVALEWEAIHKISIFTLFLGSLGTDSTLLYAPRGELVCNLFLFLFLFRLTLFSVHVPQRRWNSTKSQRFKIQ